KPDHRNEDAEARNVERKIAVGRQDVRQPGPHPVVNRVDDPPGDIGAAPIGPNTMSPVKNQERSRWLKERRKVGGKGSDTGISARCASTGFRLACAVARRMPSGRVLAFERLDKSQ